MMARRVGHGAVSRVLRRATVVACVVLLTAPLASSPHPLDDYSRTGIRRLKVYKDIHEGRISGNLGLKPGALLPTTAIQLRLRDAGNRLDVGPQTPIDPTLQGQIEAIVGRRHASYRIAIMDITDPSAPRYAAVKSNEGYIPGSVGKLLVMTGLFDGLAKAYPTDIAARERVLRETMVKADDWAMPNSHTIPVVNATMTGVAHRAVRVGDEFSLWEWVDHMVSPSSNAAATVVWKEAILLNEFGTRYPVSAEEARAFFAETPKSELSDRAAEVIEAPLRAAGLDPEGLRIRTFFTRGASRYIPGRGSYATPQQLVGWLVRLEQGRLVDPWASLEMKRLMYFTRRRYRYAFSPALDSLAVFFKSGSLYRCVPEQGYECGQYRGNAENLMHSVAIVEAPSSTGTGRPDRVYLVSMMSNVLKANSAGEHAAIAAQIEQALRANHPIPASETM